MTEAMDSIFADLRLREQKLFDELSACPVVDVTGIVAAPGVGGARSGTEKLWTLMFSLDAWRTGSGSIFKTPLTVRRKVTDKELKNFQKRIPSESIVRVRARIAGQNSFGSPQALLEAFVGLERDDAEFNDYLAELQKPVTFETAEFGTFTLNRQVNWFVADIHWCGHDIQLNLARPRRAKSKRP